MYLSRLILFLWSFYYGSLSQMTKYPFNFTILTDIQTIEVPPSSIFFLETSFQHFRARKFVLKRRWACSIESAAFHHPERIVFMIYAAPGISENFKPNNKLLKVIMKYPNVKVVQAHIGRLVENTPVNELYHNKLIDASPYKVNHYSDLLRAVTLWKYGGIYMDIDSLVLKPLDDLGGNFIGIQSYDNTLGNGVMGFTQENVSHNLLSKILIKMNRHYNASSWGGIGPILYTKSLMKLCKTSDIRSVVNRECSTIKVLPSNVFYPVEWNLWKNIFKKKCARDVLEAAKNSYALHTWYSQSLKMTLRLDSQAPYIEFAQTNCPKVFGELETYF